MEMAPCGDLGVKFQPCDTTFMTSSTHCRIVTYGPSQLSGRFSLEFKYLRGLRIISKCGKRKRDIWQEMARLERFKQEHHVLPSLAIPCDYQGRNFEFWYKSTYLYVEFIVQVFSRTSLP
jgi:hypothetical protein